MSVENDNPLEEIVQKKFDRVNEVLDPKTADQTDQELVWTIKSNPETGESEISVVRDPLMANVIRAMVRFRNCH